MVSDREPPTLEEVVVGMWADTVSDEVGVARVDGEPGVGKELFLPVLARKPFSFSFLETLVGVGAVASSSDFLFGFLAAGKNIL